MQNPSNPMSSLQSRFRSPSAANRARSPYPVDSIARSTEHPPAGAAPPQAARQTSLCGLAALILALGFPAAAMATDVVLAGADTGRILKVDSAGDVIWERSVGDTRGVAVYPADGSVVGTLIWESRAFKLTAAGEPVWDRTLTAQLNCIAVDPRDGSIVLPTYYSSRVIKLDANGEIVWDRNIGYSDHLWAAVSATDGSIIVSTGAFGVILKLDAAGNTLWQRSVTGTLYESTAVNPVDGTVVASTTTGDVYKFDAAGTLIWHRNIGRDSRNLTVNPANGRVHIGCVDNSVVTLDAAGAEVWRTSFSGSVYIGVKLAVDPADDGIFGGTYPAQRLLKFDDGYIVSDRNVGVNIWSMAVVAPPPNPSAVERLQQLAAETAAASIPQGVQRSLLVKLAAALRSLQADRVAATVPKVPGLEYRNCAQRVGFHLVPRWSVGRGGR